VSYLRKVIECIPNFSTSDRKVVEAILDEIRRIQDARLLDYTFDGYYNRLVVSFVGDEDSVLQAALNSATKAIALIDMNKHKGQHPRLGAVDVVPFVPIRNATMEDCVEFARAFGRGLAEAHHIPIYLYGEAASRPEAEDIDWVRQGEYEGLHEMMKRPGREPDFGPNEPHQTAGATIVGARRIMVGFNVNLGTPNLEVARRVARAVHGKKGGLTDVRAMAAMIPEKDMTQIGMSIGDFKKTPLYHVLELVKIEAERYGAPIVGAEFCGLVPLQALIDVAKHYLEVEELEEDRIIEIAAQKALEQT